MAITSVSKRSYPWTTTLKDRQITLRLMQSTDRDALLDFARSLPADNLLFLSVDITEPEGCLNTRFRDEPLGHDFCRSGRITTRTRHLDLQ